MSAHRAVLHFSDGARATVAVPPGARLLDACLDAGIRLQHQCRSGSCGTCIARLKRGIERPVAGRVHSLLPSETAAGWRLACSSVPQGDTEWEFDYPATLLDQRAVARGRATVRRMAWLCGSVAELEIEAHEEFSFVAGQYLRLWLPGQDLARSISMASPPGDLPVLRFLVKYMEGGALSEYLRRRCRPGDLLDIEGPYGSFVLPRGAQPRLMVAGGTGLAPLIAMLDAARQGADKGVPTRLVFGVSSPEDLFYVDELDLRRFWLPKLEVDICVGRDGDAPVAGNWHPGSVVARLERSPAPPGAVALLCGPPGMIEAARACLQAAGLPPERILAERFQPT